MKRFLKVLSFVLAVVMMLGAFASCDSEKTGDKDEYESSKKESSVESSENISAVSDSSDETSGTESEIPEPMKDLVFGTYAEYPPFAFVAGGNGIIGKYDGIDIAIAKQIGEDIGMNPVIKSLQFDDILPSLKDESIDIAISALTLDSERAKTYACSIPYYDATQVMVVKKGSDISGVSDIAAKRIAAVKDSFGEFYFKMVCGYNYSEFDSTSDAVRQVADGNCDVVLVDMTLAEKYVSDDDSLEIVKDSSEFDEEKFCIIVKKGNTELLEQINRSLEKMLEDGDIGKWAIRYLEQNILI